MKSKETKPAEVRTSSAPNSVVRKVNTVLGCRTLRAWPCRLHPRPRRRICSAMISWHRRPRQLWKHRLTLAPSAQRRRATVMAVWGSRMPLIHVRRRAPRSSACSPLRSPYPAWHRSLRAARPGRRPLQGKWPSACRPSPRSRWLQVRCKSRTAIVSVLTRHRSSLPRASFWRAQRRSSHVPSCRSSGANCSFSRARARVCVFMLHLPRFAQMTAPMPPSGFQVGHCKSTQRNKNATHTVASPRRLLHPHPSSARSKMPRQRQIFRTSKEARL